MISIDGPIRIEHHREPIGIGESAPRLSWRIEAPPGWKQAAYEIEVAFSDGPWVTRVESAQQIMVPWPQRPLSSREQAIVRVRVTGENNETSSWSEPAVVEAGLLEPDDWKAVPVGAPWPEDPDSDRRPPLLRRGFRLSGEVARARLYASAHGVYEAEINGQRVGQDILAPGWTVYGERLRYQTYDVTGLLRSGDNVIGAWLGDGWYRGRLGFGGGYRNVYGEDLSLIAQLEVTYANGKREVVSTDDDWRASFGPIRFSGLYDGEAYVAEEEQQGWSVHGFDDSHWLPVVSSQRDPGTLVAPEGPPVRRTEEIAPETVTKLENGRFLLDFGQNLVGRLRLTVDGPAGTTITVRHAEVLQNGTLYVRPLRRAQATDTFVLDDRGRRTWEPRFTIHGFRYAEIEGWPGDLAVEDSSVVARVYHTDMERTGWFASSNELFNRLHENVVWSMRGNFVDLPTDCPQRDERLGWTGDIQVFAPTASFLYDCAGMLSSWLKDLAVEQLPDGTVPWYVPVIPGGAQWTPIQPGAAWGDAAVLVPSTLHERFDDIELLRRQYASAKAWVELIADRAGEDHLWNTGKQLGDWLDPAAPPSDPHLGKTDPSLVATAYFAYSAAQLSSTAKALDLEEDAQEYSELARKVREAFCEEYVQPSGRMTSDSQTAYALALVFGLLPNQTAANEAGARLAELVSESDHRIATGFVGTPLVADALTQTGHVEAAYNLLSEEECPSWLYTVRQGGTTIWERWDSMLPDGTVNPGGMTSFNHYALGSVADWMHRVLAGLTPLEPGYRRVLVRPRPGGGVSWASAEHLSPYGRIRVSWQLSGEELSVDLALPVGVTASVEIPGVPVHEVASGTHIFTGSTS